MDRLDRRLQPSYFAQLTVRDNLSVDIRTLRQAGRVCAIPAQASAEIPSRSIAHPPCA